MNLPVDDAVTLAETISSPIDKFKNTGLMRVTSGPQKDKIYQNRPIGTGLTNCSKFSEKLDVHSSLFTFKKEKS